VTRITGAERRARIGARHLLATPSRDVDDVPAAVVALHSSDPVTVYLSAWARTAAFSVGDLEEALYERRTLVRMLGMRRTLFVVPRATASVMDEACTKALAIGERRRLIRMLEEAGIAQPGRGARWLERVEARTLAALAERGEAPARELSKAVPELTKKIAFGEDRTWAGTMGVSTRVLFMLATDGRIVRGRPLGSWISGQYRWAETATWLGAPLEDIDHGEACATLLRRYLASFGPATMTDIRWWAGWTARLATATLAEIGAATVDLDGAVGYVLADDLEPISRPEPWVALLPGLDPTVMGWKQREWYLGEHAPTLFDRSGNAGPTVWVDGRIVGGWTQAKDGRIVVELLERVARAARVAIDAEAERLREWFGDVRITPRFRTPLERALGER
jgi:Winged helix DNA-binding domain